MSNLNLPPPEILNQTDILNLIYETWGPGHNLVDCKLSDFSSSKLGLLATHLNFELTVKDEGINNLKTKYFFLKMEPKGGMLLIAEDCRLFEREIMMYTKVFPLLQKDFVGENWTPTFYMVTNSKGLILENLSRSNFAITNKTLLKDEMFAVLSTLSRMHAASIIAEKKLGHPLNEVFSNLNAEYFHEDQMFYQWMDSGIDLAIALADRIGLDSRKMKIICGHVMDGLAPSKTKQNVICHGDLWSNNILFNQDSPPKCIVIDFQISRYCRLIHDPLFVMYQCSNRKFRDDNEKALLRHYYSSLCEVMKVNEMTVHVPSWSDFSQDIDKQRISCAILAMLYAPTAYLDKKDSDTIFKDSDYLMDFLTKNRTKEVITLMENNEKYEERLVETVNEVFELGTKMKLC